MERVLFAFCFTLCYPGPALRCKQVEIVAGATGVEIVGLFQIVQWERDGANNGDNVKCNNPGKGIYANLLQGLLRRQFFLSDSQPSLQEKLVCKPAPYFGGKTPNIALDTSFILRFLIHSRSFSTRQTMQSPLSCRCRRCGLLPPCCHLGTFSQAKRVLPNENFMHRLRLSNRLANATDVNAKSIGLELVFNRTGTPRVKKR